MVGVVARPIAGDVRAPELLAAAADLVPLLSMNAIRSEAERRVPEENIHALRDAGMFRLMQPVRHGGFEVSFRTKLAIMRELGRGDGATAWVTSLMSGAAWFAGMCGDDVQDEIWGKDRGALIAGVIATTGSLERVADGFRLSGRWTYCSGSWHAQWIFLGVTAMDEDRPDGQPGLAFVPASELTIEDTWHVVGMRGTGSNTVVAENVFVPSHRFVPISVLVSGEPPISPNRGPVYRVPFASAASTDFLGPQLGMARAAQDLVREGLGERGFSGTVYQRAADSTTIQIAMAEAAYHIDVAEMLAFGAVKEVDKAGSEGTVPSLLQRARIKMHTARAVLHAREAVRTLVTVQGAGTFAESHPLQRIWRDSETASRHASTNPAIGAEAYGRALLGITETVTAMI